MAEKSAIQGRNNAAQGREDRLKAALKANMARRKAQTRARAQTDADGDDDAGQETPENE